MNNEVPRPHFSRRELVLLAILFSATFVVATGIQMGNALFPALSRLLGVPVGTVTLLVSVWAFTGLLAPLFGPPSDRYGHGMFVLIGLGSFTIGNLLCAFAPGFTPLLVFQVFVGLGYAIFNFSASAVVGDVGDLAKLVTAMKGVRSIPDARQQLAHELADCLWSVLVLSHLYDVDLEQAFLQTIDQLEQHIRGSTPAPLLEETAIKREDIGGRAADQAFFCWEDSSNGLQGICPTMGQESDGEHGRSPG